MNLTAMSLLGAAGGCIAVIGQGVVSLTAGDYVFGGIATGAASLVLYLVLKNFASRFESAEPNEYMLVIENGEQKIGKVGLMHFRQFMQNVQKFPSKMQNVNFSCDQVTREVQGVGVKGFATWSIFRLDDGPYRAYKSFDGFTSNGLKMANDNVRQLVESVLRNIVSRKSLEEVMTQRQQMRVDAKNEVLEITKGWGIWIETVEITDVRIMSTSLFKNMQAEFRSATKLKAEKIEMETSQELSDRRREFEVESSKAQQLARTSKFEMEQQQEVKREQRAFMTEEEKHKLQLQRMEQQSEVNLKSLETSGQYSQQQEQQSQELQRVKDTFRREQEAANAESLRERKRLELQLENEWTETNHKIEMMRILKHGVNRINSNVKVVNMGGNSDFQNLIPGMASMWKETMGALEG